MAIVNWLADVPSRVGSTYPRSFVIWATTPLFALGAAVWQWRLVTWPRRVVALCAIPALVLFGGLQINAYYAYLPTVGDLFRAPLPGQVDARYLDVLSSGRSGPARGRRPAPRTDIGVVSELDIPAPMSRLPHRRAFVWLPPAYFSRPRPHLPVLMLIAGTPGSPADWLRGGDALRVANAWSAAHRGSAPIMVLPDPNGSPRGDTECVDGPRGRAETYLSVDVPTFMETRFGASTDPRRWAIAGLSEGGTCALVLVARHPDRFATFGDFSGDPAPTLGSEKTTLRQLYGGFRGEQQAHDPTTWFTTDAAAGVEGCVAVGSEEGGKLRAELRLVDAAQRAHLPVRLDIIPHGGHSFRTWKHALRKSYPWVRPATGAGHRHRGLRPGRPIHGDRNAVGGRGSGSRTSARGGMIRRC